MDAITAEARLLEYKVESLAKEKGESDVEAAARIVVEHAKQGWEVTDSCGDEVARPVLIFQKSTTGSLPYEYMVKEIPPAKGTEEVVAVSDALWQMRDQGWIPACVLDSPISNPIAIFKKASQPLGDLQIKVIPVSVGVFEKTTEVIISELLDQQVRDNLSLQCIMHGGLAPVLILISKDSRKPYEYLVEHARGGIFNNQATTLGELIDSRAREGWQVSGAFEDAFFWPCVIFRRSSADMPVVPIEIAQAQYEEQSEAQEVVERVQQVLANAEEAVSIPPHKAT